jgi:hypothetical protein
MEFLWVILNYLGVEKTTTEPTVKSVSDIHLAYMPFSHSILSAVVLAVAGYVIVGKFASKPVLEWRLGLPSCRT